jgi:hypothetical protein
VPPTVASPSLSRFLSLSLAFSLCLSLSLSLMLRRTGVINVVGETICDGQSVLGPPPPPPRPNPRPPPRPAPPAAPLLPPPRPAAPPRARGQQGWRGHEFHETLRFINTLRQATTSLSPRGEPGMGALPPLPTLAPTRVPTVHSLPPSQRGRGLAGLGGGARRERRSGRRRAALRRRLAPLARLRPPRGQRSAPRSEVACRKAGWGFGEQKAGWGFGEQKAGWGFRERKAG